MTSNTYGSSNYWVDPVFHTLPVDPVAGPARRLDVDADGTRPAVTTVSRWMTPADTTTATWTAIRPDWIIPLVCTRSTPILIRARVIPGIRPMIGTI